MSASRSRELKKGQRFALNTGVARDLRRRPLRQGAGDRRRISIPASSASATMSSPACRGRSTCRRAREVAIEAAEDCELAICSAPAVGKPAARVIPPGEVETLTRGKGSNARHHPQHPAGDRAGREPAGGRSDHAGRPLVELSAAQARPRRAARGDAARGDLLSPPVAAAGLRLAARLHRRPLRSTRRWRSSDRDVVLVPRGYHPVGAPHGYDLYYLNVMAGPKRMWRFHNDPAHEWLTK